MTPIENKKRMPPAPILPIGVLLGKADASFKLVGGSSIVFNLIRSRIFGKVLRAVEYPDGNLHHDGIYHICKTYVVCSSYHPVRTGEVDFQANS